MTAPATLRAAFRVDFAREYHVGAGHGRDTSLDSALFTDGEGPREAPAIRYAHGVLRQAVYDLLQTGAMRGWRRCGRSGEPGRPADHFCAPGGDRAPCPLCRIFGSPAHPSPWDFSTMRPLPGQDGAPAGGTARVVSRASVDLRSRRAADRTLFSEELGAPLAFGFEAARTPGGDAGAAMDELALLAMAARCVPALGADRRRGRGECTVTLDRVEGAAPDAGRDALPERFAAAWLGEEPDADAYRLSRSATPFAPGAVAAVWTAADPAHPREEVRLFLRLEEPVAAGALPLTGNLLEGETFLPGTLLLGALAGRVLGGGGAGEEHFLRAFRGGGVLFPDLLPAAEADGRAHATLPAPRDLFTCPHHPGPAALGGHGVWSPVLAELGVGPAKCPACDAALKPRRLDGYLFAGGPGFATDDGGRYRVEPPGREETKIQVDPASGRVREASLYHRQVLPAGTLLSGVLLAGPGALEVLQERGMLDGERGTVELRLGKRYGRGYGRAALAWEAVPAEEVARARALTRARVEAWVSAGLPVPVVLASRLLLRDAFGRTRQRLTPEDLGLRRTGGAGRGAACAVSSTVAGGFWRHVGLPRRREHALQAGSVLHLDPASVETPDGASLAEHLARLAHGGALGERTAEGFGRVAVAPFPYDWIAGAPPAAGPPEPLSIPEEVRRPAAAGPEDPLGRRAGGRRVERYVEALERAGVQAAGDEWRLVARLLYARAGAEASALAAALEGGGGPPAEELARVGPGREAKSFLRDKGGKAAWEALRPVLEEAAHRELPAPERARRTRALADALARGITPGKEVG